MAKKNTATKQITYNEEIVFEFIKDRAMHLWYEAGNPEGNDWEYWLQAEAEVRKRLSKVVKF